MNWIEIDKILYRMLSRHTVLEEVYAEAQKHFKWDISQARAAIDPLAKRSNFVNSSVAQITQNTRTIVKKRQNTRKSK